MSLPTPTLVTASPTGHAAAVVPPAGAGTLDLDALLAPGASWYVV